MALAASSCVLWHPAVVEILFTLMHVVQEPREDLGGYTYLNRDRAGASGASLDSSTS